MADPRRPRRNPSTSGRVALADRVLAQARRRGLRVAVAIVDRRGDPIQQDCMDGAATAGPFVAEAVAAGAATFQLPSDEVPDGVAALLPYRSRALPGGLPVREGGASSPGWAIAGASPRAVPRDRRRGARP